MRGAGQGALEAGKSTPYWDTNCDRDPPLRNGTPQAGPQRSRILGLLYKDERVRSARFFGVLEKMSVTSPPRPSPASADAYETPLRAGTRTGC